MNVKLGMCYLPEAKTKEGASKSSETFSVLWSVCCFPSFFKEEGLGDLGPPSQGYGEGDGTPLSNFA